MNDFAQPNIGGDNFEAAAHNGRLLLIYPQSYQQDFETKHGVCAAATADVVVVDDPGGKPLPLFGTMLFGNLARSVQSNLGGVVLGRLGQGPNTKGNPPWILRAYDDADAQAARPAHDAYKRGDLKDAAPAADPWNTADVAPHSAPAIPGADPSLVAFLATKGVDASGMAPAQAQMIARTFGA